MEMNDIFQSLVEEILTTKYQDQIEMAVDAAVSSIGKAQMQKLVMSHITMRIEDWFDDSDLDQSEILDDQIKIAVKSALNTKEVKDKIKEMAIKDLTSENSQEWITEQIGEYLYDSPEWSDVLEAIASRIKLV